MAKLLLFSHPAKLQGCKSGGVHGGGLEAASPSAMQSLHRGAQHSDFCQSFSLFPTCSLGASGQTLPGIQPFAKRSAVRLSLSIQCPDFSQAFSLLPGIEPVASVQLGVASGPLPTSQLGGCAVRRRAVFQDVRDRCGRRPVWILLEAGRRDGDEGKGKCGGGKCLEGRCQRGRCQGVRRG